MSTLTAYRSLLRLTGGAFIGISMIARLPLAMSQIGTLLLISDLTGSYGAGGVSAGALAVANAVGAPLWGSIADRRGQRGVLVVQSIGGAIAFAALLLVAHSDLHWGFAAAASAVAGFLLPQVGPMSRVRWRPVTEGAPKQETLVSAAFSYEGAADEASFVLGPALIGLVVALANPTVAIASAGVMLLIFGTLFALHPTATSGHPHDPAAALDAGRLVTLPLLILCGTQLVIGMMFGSVQTGTSVLTTEAGSPHLTGFLHALLGVGSVTAGLMVPSLSEKFGLPLRLKTFAIGLLVLSAPLLLVGSIAALVPVLLVLGVVIAPYMITGFTVGERITPVWRTGTVMTLLAAATGMGYALGSSLAGTLADLATSDAQRAAFAVTVAAGALAVLISWSGAGALRRALDTAALERTPAEVPTDSLSAAPQA